MASGWVYRACYRHSCTKNPELATLFARCSRLVQLAVNPLFIFDGPGRPRRKRGKHVRGNPHWIECDFKKMLDALGFAWKDAPGEAESELASLSKQGLLDAVLTEDSDTVVFSARTIIRFDGNVPDDEQVLVYRASDIENHADLMLTHADLVLIALLVGGDYDHGIKDCGIETAFGLARAGFGHSLSKAVSTCAAEDLPSDLDGWRTALCHEVITNSSKKLPRHCPTLAKNIPDDFPCNDILFAYFQPLISWEDPPCLSNRLPSPPTLARFAEEHFTWGDVIGILEHFTATIYPGLALRIMMQIASAHDLGLQQPHIHSLVGEVITTRQQSSLQKCARSPELRMQLNISKEMINEIVAALHNQGNKNEVESWISKRLPKLRAWIPVAVKQVVG
ncbi:PIN domain-like protein [Gymnopilus junonius]|uniref:PIN domain-like protein n=1 Tax=Gymnopilus junonius TaxID=109634 RepID=A0A9P5N8W0_GYMJU|nr:PIN domain-like protein [Gymnopilus junonius]